MKLLLLQENRSLARPSYHITDENGASMLRAKSRSMDIVKNIDVLDMKGVLVANIAKTISFLPKFKIKINEGNEFILHRKLSIYQDYKIRGIPVELLRNVNGSYMLKIDSGRTVNVDFQGDIAGSRYELDIAENGDIVECVCIVLAIDLANKIVDRLQYRN